jgi:hypothetical protein
MSEVVFIEKLLETYPDIEINKWHILQIAASSTDSILNTFPHGG